MQAPQWIRLAGRSLNSNSPVILTGLAVGGVVATAILAARAMPQANSVMFEAADEQSQKRAEEGPHKPGDDCWNWRKELTPLQKIQLTWRIFLPAGVSGAATIVCIVGANQIGMRRNAALLGAYSLADTAFREYKDEVLKQLGKTKEQNVRDEVAKRQMDENPVENSQVIITGGGEQLCFDSLTGRYFRSDVENIRRAENEINRRIVAGDMYLAHNEFYDLLGLEHVVLGSELGWNIDNPVKIVFTAHLATDGNPCLSVGYENLPRVDYDRL